MRYALKGPPKWLIWKGPKSGKWLVALTDDTRCPVGKAEAFTTWRRAMQYAEFGE